MRIQKKLMSSILAWGFMQAPTVFADAPVNPPTDLEFPALMTDKCPQVIYPKVGSGKGKPSPVVFSASCKTAYVLPSSTIPIQEFSVSRLAGSHAQVCQSWAHARDYVGTLYQTVGDLAKALAKDPSNASLKATYDDLSAQVKTATHDLRNNWAGVGAIRVKVTVQNDQADQVEQLRALNNLKDVTFAPMYLYGAELALGGKPDTGAGCIGVECLGAIASVDFPDSKVKRIDNVDVTHDEYHVSMYQGAQGTFDINVPTYCDALKDSGTDALSKEKLYAYFSMKLTSQYPIRANKSFHIVGNTDINAIVNNLQKITKDKYTREEFLASLINGRFGQALTITIDNGPVPGVGVPLNDIFKKNDDDSPTIYSAVGTLINKMLSNYVDSVTGVLKLAKLIESSNDQAAKPAPDVEGGDSTDLVGVNQVCNSNSGFFGIGASRSCHDEGIYITVHHTGLSKQQREVVAQFNNTIDTLIDVKDIAELTNTTTFTLPENLFL